MKRLLLVVMFVGSVLGQKPDTMMVFKIKEEALKNSEVMQTLDHLTNRIGPRLTNSKKMAEANVWTKSKLESLGLLAEIETFGEFGYGWDVTGFSASVTAPYAFPLIAYPKAWSPAPKSPVKGKVVWISGTDLAAIRKVHEGKLKNAIVLLADQNEVVEDFEPLAHRFSDSELLEMANEGVGGGGGGRRARMRSSPRWKAYVERQKVFSWINDQGPALVIDAGGGATRDLNSGIVNVQGAAMPLSDTSDVSSAANLKPWNSKAPRTAPQITVAVEQVNQMIALIRGGKDVQVECSMNVEWSTKDTRGYNTIGTWEGTDLKEQVVMVGAHLDSWHAATGATDNAQGVAVITEAVRILKKIGFRPRRSVRLGFWSAEEQGLHGSEGYVEIHLKDSNGTKPGYDNFSTYFNLDNGAGQIRGLYLQGNEKAESFFRTWFEPFKSWGVGTLSLRSSFGSDQLSFDRAGLPGFQFIQDPIAYGSKTWHTNMDHYDHVIPEDMKRNAAIVACFIYMSSTIDEMVPRKGN